MAIEDKATYGEHYWAMQVEAATLLAKEAEKDFSGMAARLMGKLGISAVLPDELKSLFSEIEAPAGAFLGEVGGRFVSEVADGAVSKTTSPLMESIGYLSYIKWPTKKITPEATAQLFSRKKISDDFFNERFRMGGFEPIEAKFQFDAMRPYPTIPDLILYSRYHGSPDNVWGTLEPLFDVDPTDFKLWEWLGLQRLTTLQVHTLYRRGLITQLELFDHLSKIGWSATDRPFIEESGWTIPNAMLLVQGDLLQGESTDKIIKDISIADINPKYAQNYLDAILTKPASQDLVAYELRQDPNLGGLDNQLKKIGIHPNYFDIYKELAHPIPPVADIITMAVREAFSPEIATRFGQYEDFPTPFAEWAAKKGLSQEWSERYWASHWSLPSAGQGFEMLHRGAITREELDLLLRALDVMPFWRDKLTKIAYKRLTRVDIRRMYGVGVLTEEEVYEANLELGYTERDSRRMADFTVKARLQTLSKFTSNDVLTAYTKRMIDRSEARTLLTKLEVRDTDISVMLSNADYKREWELTENRIAAIKNLYKKRVYDENKTSSELLRLDLPSEQVELLMEQWYFEAKAEPDREWTTSQTLGFIKTGLITQERGIAELRIMGYNTEHINVFMESIK